MPEDMSSEIPKTQPESLSTPPELQSYVWERFLDEKNDTYTVEDRRFVSALNRVIINTQEHEPNNLAASDLSQAISLAINTKQEGNYLDKSIKNIIEDLFDPKHLPSKNHIPPKNIPFHKAIARPLAEGVRALITNAIALDLETEKANRDPLTGLYNSRVFEKKLKRLYYSQSPCAVVYIDLDNFKQVNDTFDHRTGDRVLMEFARILESIVRPGDLIARLHGEEFAYIIEGIGEDVIEKRLETLRELIEIQLAPTSLSKTQLGKREKITASIGFVHKNETEKRVPIQLLHEADVAMQSAKNKGKNKVVNFENLQK